MAARKKSGFTLIELLVVIAIIAILAAILFPVFARAREAARKSTCQSNMKEIAIALQTYWNDYDATLPSSMPQRPPATPGTTLDAMSVLFCSGVGVLPPGIPGDPRAFPVTWAQMLYNAHKGRDICFCPSDSADHSPQFAQAYDVGYTRVSYWWKGAIDLAWRLPALKCQKEGDFGYNADQIVFYEHAGFHSGASGGIKNDVQINCVYLDTHVKSVSVANSTALASGSTYVNDPAADGEPNYFNFDNELVKSVPPLTPTSNPPTSTTPVVPGTSAPYKFLDPRRYSDVLP
jgi:prepilin-type N-terminal cleavage/methylation domain-containing protein